MGFKKAFAKQDAEIEEVLALVRESQTKVKTMAENIYAADSNVTVRDVQRLQQVVNTLRTRLHRLDVVKRRFDFIGG